jgi:high-affinity Fe2+/Pb2+ permease
VYCGEDLTPRWDFDDIEKALLLACPVTTDGNSCNSSSVVIGLGVGLGALVAVALVATIYFHDKSTNLQAELVRTK